MDTAEREYVLGTNDAELERLGFQHQVWSTTTTAAWERAGFRPGARLLDVGCGPGHATFDLAGLVGPTGHVLAVDVSPRFVGYLQAEAGRRGVAHVEARVQDLAQLDLPAASLDGAFARWVLCFVRDPATIVGHVARALRPGATFVVLDYCQYEAFAVVPRGAAIVRGVEAVAGAFRAAGGDPDVGQRIPALMRDAGLVVETLRPIVRLARPGSALWEWPRRFFQNFLPTLVQAGTLTEDERLAFMREWEARAVDPDAFVLTPPMIEVIGRRPA